MSGLGQWFLGRFWRQRTIWIVALLAILCVAGFGGYTWWQRENYRHQETAQLDKVAQTVAFDMMENVSERQFPPKVNDQLQELRRKMIIALSQKRQAVQKGQTKKYLAADITRWQLAGDYYRLDPVGLARYGPTPQPPRGIKLPRIGNCNGPTRRRNPSPYLWLCQSFRDDFCNLW
jgi:hypothetical protein